MILQYNDMLYINLTYTLMSLPSDPRQTTGTASGRFY